MIDLLYDLNLFTVLLFFGGLFLTGYLLWTQVKEPVFTFKGLLLWIPSIVFVFLFLQFFTPALIKKTEKFFPPGILIGIDASGSYQGGMHPGHEEELQKAVQQIEQKYTELGFNVNRVYFDSRVYSMESSPDKSTSARERLTDIEGMLYWAQDSSGQKNSRAVFLFTDGVHTRSRELPELTSRIPVFPVMLDGSGNTDVQLEKVTVFKSSLNNRGRYSTEFTLKKTGSLPEKFFLSFLQGGREFYQLPLRSSAVATDPGPATLQLPFRGNVSVLTRGNVKASLGGIENDNNPHNDTVNVISNTRENLPRIGLVSPATSVDERWFINVLDESGRYNLVYKSLQWFKVNPSTEIHQLWISAANYNRLKLNAGSLKFLKVPIIVFGHKRIPARGLSGFKKFPLEAEVIVEQGQAENYEYAHYSLENLTSQALSAPGDRGDGSCMISVKTPKTRGCMLTRLTGDRYYFALSNFWKKLFDPSVSYIFKEQVKSLIMGTTQISRKDSQGTTMRLPDRIYEDVPFNLKGRYKADSLKGQVPALLIEGKPGKFNYSLKDMESGRFKSEDIQLKQGHYHIKITKLPGQNTIWSDSIIVLNRASLEMKNTGYNKTLLNALAEYSGGEVIQLPGDSLEIAGYLPELASAQSREVEEIRTELYNNKVLLIIVLLLLSGYWITRKKMSLD